MANFHETHVGSQFFGTILNNSRRIMEALEKIATSLATIADELRKAREDKNK
jgi:hypothetical protein